MLLEAVPGGEWKKGSYTMGFPDAQMRDRPGRERPWVVDAGRGRFVVGISDICRTCGRFAEGVVTIPSPPRPMKRGTTVIAFIEDPDGYKIELIQQNGGV